MRGNYLSDRFNTGAVYDENAFEITNWKEIDLFCYFSHNFVTIPPVTWVQSSRRHGSRVLGTFITEWEAGNAICVELFSSLEAVRVAVTALVGIAQDYDLDGWLINIENTLPTECVENVILFLQLLTKEMREIRGVHSQVMWYDAVTMEGKLQWQDGLTALNKPFFDACDSIFINYTWKEPSLVKTRCLLELEKGNVSRCSDVYYGVDVFGRGTIGGGGYNCCEALNLLDGVCEHPEISTLQSYSYSAAVFAPGWLLETQCTEVESTDCVYSKYHHQLRTELATKSRIFWNKITLNPKKSKCVVCEDNCRSSTDIVDKSTIEYWGTGFSSSSGLSIFLSGYPCHHWTTVDGGSSPSPFYNLSLQDMNWEIVDSPSNLNDPSDIRYCDEFGWEGCGSMEFCPNPESNRGSTLYVPFANRAPHFTFDYLMPCPSFTLRTTECRASEATSLRIEILCHLKSVAPTACCGGNSEPPLLIKCRFTGSRSAGDGFNMSISDDPDRCIIIDCNRTVRTKSSCPGIVSSSLKSADDDSSLLLWDECSYSLPPWEEVIPAIKDHFEIANTTSARISVESVSICLESLTSGMASVRLGSLSFVHGADAALEHIRDNITPKFDMIVSKPQISDVKLCSVCNVTERRGVTLQWASLSLINSLNGLLYPFEGVNILTIGNEGKSLRDDYVNSIMEATNIHNADFDSKNAALFSLDKTLTQPLTSSLHQSSMIPLGMTRKQSCRLNLLPEHRYSKQLEFLDGRIKCIEVYLLFLQPYSFAFRRPLLNDCQAFVLCIS